MCWMNGKGSIRSWGEGGVGVTTGSDREATAARDAGIQ